MCYFTNIDPIGEGCKTVDATKDNFLKDKIEGIANNVHKTTYQLEFLKQVIDMMNTYSENVFLIKKLEGFHKNISEASSNILETLCEISEKYNLETED